MQEFDYVVIGGGIVGLSTALSIVERDNRARMAVVEKESDWAQHQTGRNSGVIHSGIYYKPGSLKAKLCRNGGRRMYEFCDEHGLQYEKCGKMIVATTEAEIPRLQNIYQRGIENGLEIKKLTNSEIRESEPHVKCVQGIHVPSTGIVNYADVCRKMVELIAARGGDLRLESKVIGFSETGGRTIIETSRGPMETKWTINCAGLQCDRVAKLAGADPGIRIVPFRGEYFELTPERKHLVKNLIYPVPDPNFPFLGVHFTRMIDGSVHAGPNAVLSFKREGYFRTSFNLRDCMDTLTYSGFWRLAANHAGSGLGEIRRSFSKKAFVRSLQRLIPEINEEDLIPAKAGVRAQALLKNGGLVDDFLIINSNNATHVCNAPSPAATASLEIGRLIADLLPERVRGKHQ